jgi:hypothetical protein
MPGAREHMEHAERAQHAASESRKIALLIAVLAVFLSFSAMLAKGAQTAAIEDNVQSSDSWAFFQAKDIRRTLVNAEADQTALLTANASDSALKAAIDKQIATWRQTAARYESDPKTGEGRKELAERARAQETDRDLAMAEYHHYELASAAFEVGIVLASAMVITGVAALAWFAGALGVAGLGLLGLGLYAPHAVALISGL